MGGGQWQPPLSTAVTAFFTTYLVAAFGFAGLQQILEDWIDTTFGFAAQLDVGGATAIVGAINQLCGDTIATAEQVRA